ncbi:MAG: hypothetical protein ACKVOR_11005 [Flavobacteriales bacterium]
MRLSLILLSLATIIGFTACKTPMVGYVTSTHNMPILREQFDFRAMGAIGINHTEFQAAFSPLKHVGLMVNTYAGVPGGSYEAGFGYYVKPNSFMLLEVYGLYNQANLSRTSTDEYKLLSEYYDTEIQKLQAAYRGYTLQGDVAFLLFNKKGFKNSIALGAKFSRAFYSYFKYESWYYERYEPSLQSLARYELKTLPKSNLNFLQLSVTHRVGYKWIDLMFQYSHHLNIDGLEPSDEEPPYFKKYWLTIGIEVNISKIKNSEPETSGHYSLW